MSVKTNSITNAFSSVDSDNIHVAIAANIAAELWERHPSVHFQTMGPAKDAKLPGDPRPLTQAVVTFTFAKLVYFCDKMQSLNHIGTIRIDDGLCKLKVTDPVTSSYQNKTYLLDKEWPLEFPGFPDVLYDELTPVLSDVTGAEKRQADALEYLYEVKKKGNKPRHLTESFHTDPIKTLCGQKIRRSDAFSIQESYDYTRDGQYCCNCRESRIFKARRGEI